MQSLLGYSNPWIPALVLTSWKQFFLISDKVHIFFFLQADDMTPGVIYLGHIPHGFYEDQIRDFFSQFGTVNKVRLSRSKKVGDSDGRKEVKKGSESRGGDSYAI